MFADFSLATGTFNLFQTYTYTIATTPGVVQVGGSTAGSLSTVAVTGNYASPANFSLSCSGNNLVLSFTPVPEPMATLAVFAVGLARSAPWFAANGFAPLSLRNFSHNSSFDASHESEVACDPPRIFVSSLSK